jgi:hypothetical protein
MKRDVARILGRYVARLLSHVGPLPSVEHGDFITSVVGVS